MDAMRELCKSNSKFEDDYLFHHFQDEYHPVMEYVILNHGIQEIDFIVEGIKTNPRITTWDYKTRTLNFGKERSYFMIGAFIASILKIIIEHDTISDKVLENCMYLLKKYLHDHNFADNQLLVITVMLVRKKWSVFLAQFVKLMDDQFKSFTDRWPISSKLRYNYEIDL
jgi:hypothetical protein